jgi:tetratricopeptide (TPR) repeat protein
VGGGHGTAGGGCRLAAGPGACLLPLCFGAGVPVSPLSGPEPTRPPPPGIYYEQGRLEAAIGAYRRALALQPVFPEAYNNLGNALRELGRADEAIACYTACIQQQYARAGGAPGPALPAPGGALPARGAALSTPGALPALGGAGGAAGGGALAPVIAQRLGVAYNNLGGLLKMTGQAAAAIACYEQVRGFLGGGGALTGVECFAGSGERERGS